MIKKLFKPILTFFLAFFCVFGTVTFSGCGGSDNETITIVDFKDETIEVAYGSIYQLELQGTDNTGKAQTVTATVKNSTGEIVSVAGGKFPVSDKDGYVIEYAFGAQKRTVPVKVVNGYPPVVQTEGTETALFCGEVYTVAKGSAVDNYDGELPVTTEIYKVGATEDVLVEFDKEKGEFTPTESGMYYVLYTATNSNAVTGTKKIPFYVRAPAKAGEWESFDDKGCIYTTVTLEKDTREVSYLDEFEGRQGVVCMELKNSGSVSLADFWRIAPKSKNSADYENYRYIVIPVYIEGDVSTLSEVSVMQNCTLTDLKAGEWVTYYFNVAAWNNGGMIEKAIAEGAKATGKAASNAKVYIDSIYFADDAGDIECTFTRTGEFVSVEFTADNMPDGYKVTYKGMEMPVTDGKFKAFRVGEYVVEPLYYDKNTGTEKRFVYNWRGVIDSSQTGEFDAESGDTIVVWK